MGPATTVERPSALTGLARSGIALGAVVVLLVRELLEGNAWSFRWGLVAAAAGGVVLLAGLSGVFTARTTRFVADAEEFRVERRFLYRSSARLDYTKVQAVEIAQPFIARMLGLAKLHVDVGSAGGVDLAFLRRARAESLRELLLSRARNATADASSTTPAAEENEPIVRLRPRTLALGTIVSTNAAAGVLAGGSSLLAALWTETPLAVAGVAVAVGGWLWHQIGGNWGFIMVRDGETLRITRGLASTTAQGVPRGRIQGVVVSQDLLQRVTGLYRIHVTVLGFAADLDDASKATSSLLLPFGSRDDVDRVIDAIWPGASLGAVATTRQPRRARWLTPLAYPYTCWGIDDTLVLARHGWLRRTVTAVPHRRIQSLGITQGPLQRHLRLAALGVHTTDGPVTLRLFHLDEYEARRLLEEAADRARAARTVGEWVPRR